jgi:hypothetical protein
MNFHSLCWSSYIPRGWGDRMNIIAEATDMRVIYFKEPTLCPGFFLSTLSAVALYLLLVLLSRYNIPPR